MNDQASGLRNLIVEAADNITFFQQLEMEDGPVVLMNVFRFAPEDKEAVVAAWEADAAYMKTQPGNISAQLHESVGGGSVLFNYAVWQRLSDLRQAVQSEGFLSRIAEYPASVRSSPHVFKAIGTPGVCSDQPMVLAD